MFKKGTWAYYRNKYKEGFEIDSIKNFSKSGKTLENIKEKVEKEGWDGFIMTDDDFPVY